MAKTTFLGTVTMESQGQDKICTDYIDESGGTCERKQCAAECTAKWNGVGTCFDAYSNTCICKFKCKT
ncbi:unnamed protein product [Eruca vesicaria subsp. sativa]|uniref:Defensin-like protein n=1 Tax=Eruca vesicaria subsp. sativa TaxID=29727 RepID=A0ABC8LFR5_ERUVS|nr:unnamed protein product [Eruca vesicaria subsp. sativa]